jgi:ABC-2 type transport system ATP-binding protein
MISELNREQGATIVLTTHVMEEAEELCGDIALLRQGELIAHQPTAELTRSLHLARPITLIVRPTDARAKSIEEMFFRQEWERDLAQLPGVTGASMGSSASTSGDAVVTVSIDSLDLRVTTPALLAWVQAQGHSLVSMQAEPVTLTDVFTTLTRRGPTLAHESVDTTEGRGDHE